MQDDEMKELLESFIIETQEILENLDQDLMTLESTPDDLDLLNSIFRSFHTIKGTSSFMGFEQITKITHEAEDLLNKLRRSELKADTHIVDLLLEVYDWLKVLAEKVEANDQTPVDYGSTLSKLERINAAEDDKPQETATTGTSAAASGPDEGSVVNSILNNAGFGSGEGDFTEDEYELLEKAFAEINASFGSKDKNQEPKTESAAEQAPEARGATRVKPESAKAGTASKPDKSTPAETNGKSSGATAPNVRVTAETTIRVDVNRLESLMDLSGELVLGRNRLAQITQDVAQKYENHEFLRELQETSSQLNFITTELQSAIMKTRMVPIAKLFQKAPRMVRDLSKEFGKEISLLMSGEETELDRGIIEELSDPLVHMIRNSCDHGIEKPGEREKSGKARKGTLRLEAEHEGNHIVIRIMDDGKGMDPEKLKAKAIEKNVLTPEQAHQLSDRDSYNLIFAPGFSTAEKVTNVSGRGVGMDVVRTNIQHLKGIIEVDSNLGAGSTFTIKLPLTLAIIQGLLVGVDQEIFALPLSSVIEVVATDLKSVYTVNQNEVIRIRDQVIPLLRLGRALNLPNERETLENRYVVVVGLANNRIGLVVDELLGQQEIVIKSLGEYLGHVPGIAGSTILGDGRVIMIIDISELFRKLTKGVSANSFEG